MCLESAGMATPPAQQLIDGKLVTASDGATYLAATTIFVDGGIMHSSPGL